MPLLSNSTESTTADIIDSFLVRHTIVCQQMARYSICTPAITKTLPSHGAGDADHKAGSGSVKAPPTIVTKTASSYPPPTVQSKKSTASSSVSLQTAATRTKVLATNGKHFWVKYFDH